MIRVAALCALALGCSSSTSELEQLQAESRRVARDHQPQLDAIAARLDRIKRHLRGNLPGWENMLRTAELANDELGLPAFTQISRPGPAWRPSPATLLGIEGYVRDQVAALVARHDLGALRYLVDDERKRYDVGIAEATAHVAQVEQWLDAARAP